MEVSASLREGYAAGTETKTPELLFTVVNVHRFETKIASEGEDV